MQRPGIQQQADALLSATNMLGGYSASLVCTAEGLVVASAGQVDADEDTAAFASLFDDVCQRAQRDLRFDRVDEVTLLDPGRDRTVIRPLDILGGHQQLFLVVRVPVKKTWRRNTNMLCRQLISVLAPLVGGEAA